MTAATLSGLNQSFTVEGSDGSIRIAISGTFTGTLTLYVKDTGASNTTYRAQKTYTAPTMPDGVLEVFGRSTFKLEMTAYTSGSAVCDMRIRELPGGGG